VGWFKDGQPGAPRPAHLLRPEPIDGHQVKLADGNPWLIPIARSIVQGATLPERLVLGPNGKVVREPLERFAELSAAAERIWHRIVYDNAEQAERENMEDPGALSTEELFDIACQALAVNYRIGRWEISALKLLTSQTAMNVVKALVDLPTIERVSKAIAKKKSTPDTSSTAAGGPDSSPGTAPPSPTSSGSTRSDS
jgi:hypothetical protein